MIAIDVDRVVRVLIDGEWYHVEDGTFEVDAFTFTYNGQTLNLDLGPGFQFEWAATAGQSSKPVLVSGPLSVIQAINHASSPTPSKPPTGLVLDVRETDDGDPLL